MLKLKLQYFGHLIRRADSSEKTLMLGKIEGRRRRGNRGWEGWMASSTQGAWIWANSFFFSNLTGPVYFCISYVYSLGIIWFPRWSTEIAPSWSGKIITTCLSCLTTVGPDKVCRKLTSRMYEEPKGGRRHQFTICLVTITWKNFRGAKRKNEDMICLANLPEILTLESSRMTGQRQPGKLTSLP